MEQGVTAVWYLIPTESARETDVTLGRGRVRAIKMDGWAEHPFWQKMTDAQRQI